MYDWWRGIAEESVNEETKSNERHREECVRVNKFDGIKVDDIFIAFTSSTQFRCRVVVFNSVAYRIWKIKNTNDGLRFLI